MAGAPQAPVQHAPFDAGRRPIFVIGNEAADVDSLVSAYAYARLIDGPEVQGIALAQITREEFRLRGDALALFASAGSELHSDGSPAHLRFWDEVDWDAVARLEPRALVLTDHNRMTDKVSKIFAGLVERILDHHAGGGSHPEAIADIDEGLGSACTIVAEHFLEKRSGEVPPEFGHLLAGVILLDNRDFDPKEKKGNARDEEAFRRLSAHIPSELGQAGWYKQLMHARLDVSHLSVRELLMLDMKAASVDGFQGKVAFSAMMTTLDGTVERAGSAEALFNTMRDFALARGFVAVVCNFSKDESGFKALGFAPAAEEHRALCEAIEARVAGAPGNLPQELRDNDLYAAQGILEHGFGLVPKDGLAPLRALAMRAAISRKTLLPRATSAATAAAL